LARIGLGACLACVFALLPPPAQGAQRGRDVKRIHHKSRSFRIPFNIDEADRPRIKEVQLYISTDAGASWSSAGRASPDQPSFTYRAPSDGEYWIAVRTLDTKGRLYPRDDATIEPGMKVVVDTTPPLLTLEPNGRRGSRASVRWEIRDDNLDPNSLTIEYQSEGARDWRQVPIHSYDLLGSEEWDAGTASSIKVRASIEDLAHNRQTASIVMADGLAPNPNASASTDDREFDAPPPIISGSPARRTTDRQLPDEEEFAPPDGPAVPAPELTNAPQTTAGGALLVGSPRFPLQYQVEDAGPDGPALVELWFTRDSGRSWSRMPEDPDRRSPYEVDLHGEGTFGLWLVVQSASGLGDPPPQPGDRPQSWVEVDATAPVVQLDRPRIGIGQSAGKILITWRATDPHLAPRPISISYRPDRPDASWTPIREADRVDNTGRFVWTLPGNVPPRFHLKIDAVDSLGNRGTVETTDGGPILVDRTRPKGRIVGLDPAAGTSTRQ
jgi:hypothetical protein